MLGVKRIERVLPTGTSLTVVGEVCIFICASYNQEVAEADNLMFGSTVLIHSILMLLLQIILLVQDLPPSPMFTILQRKVYMWRTN